MLKALMPIGSVLDHLVHESAGDAVSYFRHRAFLTAHLSGGLIGILAIPVYLAIVGAPSASEAVAFAWLATPLLLSVGLSRGGRLERAEAFSLANFTTLVAVAVWMCGGLASSVVCWFIPVLLYAASTGRRNSLLNAAVHVIMALAILAVGQVWGVPPVISSPTLLWTIALADSAIICIVYAVTVAAGLDSANRQAAKMQSEEDARYRLLADNATDLITRHTRSGNVLFASPAARDLFGIASSDLLDNGLFSLVHVGDRPAYLTVFADAAELGTTATVEFRIRKTIMDEAVPQWRWVEMRCRRFNENAADDAVELVAVTRDIEAHRRQQEALRLANELTEKASDAKTRFLANISHELRTPLNAIIGFSEMLSMEMPIKLPPERVVEYAVLINESGRHLLDVVNGILDMSKLEAGSFTITPEPFDVGALVKRTVAMMAPMAEKADVKLTCDVPLAGRELVADPRACKQILLNFLSNALKFTDKSGDVSVALAFDARNAFLTVRDTGVGIDERDLPTLATPFVQAQSSYDRRYEGTGLGLSVVKGLAELHGGSLNIRSKLGVGTSVTVRLPIEADASVSTIRRLQPTSLKDDGEQSTRRQSVA